MNMTRAWRLAGVVLFTLMAFSGVTWAAGLPRQAADMERAHGEDAVKVKDDVLAAVPPDPVARNNYAKEVVKEFEGELTSSNGDARLNTAILIERLESLACDKALEKMLKNDDPAVRLWGAKGLGAIAPTLKKVGGRSEEAAVQALHDAAGAETSEVVKGAIDRALGEY
jgi:hypothetical protein